MLPGIMTTYSTHTVDDAMNDFLQGFIKGAMETPKGFFAPVIAVWRLLIGVTDSLINEKVEGQPGSK